MTTPTTPATPELRAQIIAFIKGGLSIAQAAGAHHLSPKTISKWMRQMSGNAHATTNELHRARKQIAFLAHVILGLVLEQESQTYKG